MKLRTLLGIGAIPTILTTAITVVALIPQSVQSGISEGALQQSDNNPHSAIVLPQDRQTNVPASTAGETEEICKLPSKKSSTLVNDGNPARADIVSLILSPYLKAESERLDARGKNVSATFVLNIFFEEDLKQKHISVPT